MTTLYPVPATPLPWPTDRIRIARPDSDVAYAIRAANAFPHLVAALTYVDAHWPSNVVREALAIARGEVKP